MHIFSYITLKKITFDLCEFSRQSDLFQQDLLFTQTHKPSGERQTMYYVHTTEDTTTSLQRVFDDMLE